MSDGCPLRISRIRNLILLLTVFTVWPPLTSVAGSLILDAAMEEVSLTGHVEYLEDPGGQFDIGRVSSPQFSFRFLQHYHGPMNFGYTTSVYWLRFALRQKKSRPSPEWLLEIEYPHLDQVTLFRPLPSGGFHVERAGDLVPSRMKEIPHANPIFRLTLEERLQIFYLRVRTSGSMQLPLRISTASAFYRLDRNRQYIFGLYYGILLAVSLYNLFLFASIRDWNFLFYVIYISSFAFLQLNLNRIGVDVLWPDFPIRNEWVLHVTAGLVLFCGLFFARRFLSIRRNLPRMSVVFNVLMVGGVAASFLPIVLGYAFFVKAYSILTLASILAIFISAVACLRKGYRPARFFLIAWSVFLGGVLIYILWGFGLLATNILTRYGILAGSGLEAILLSLALADRMNIIREEYASALTEIVDARTEQVKGGELKLKEERSARRRTEKSFRESEEKYRILVENSAIAIGISRGERIVFGNQAMLELLGYDSMAELKRESLIRLVVPEDRENVRVRIQQRMAGEKVPRVFENRLLRKDGQPITVEQVSSQVLIDGDKYLLSTFKDISDWKKTEEAQRMARERAEEANRVKAEFLTNISHEIRTPMQAIMGYANLAIDRFKQTKKDKLLEYFQEISQSGKRLLTLLNNLLDLSKLESGKMEYFFEKESFSFLIDFAIRELRALTDEKQLVFRFTEPDFDDNAYLDRDKMMQVVHNLLGNAVKFSPEKGTITLDLARDDYYLVFSVTDQGVGIPEKELEYIFDKFTQSSSTKTGAGGTGLGLAICREIVQVHGGEIKAENAPAGGARFTMRLPLKSSWQAISENPG